MTTSKRYHIATAADEKYYVPMYVMLLSLFENNKDLSFNIAVLQKDFTSDNKKEVGALANQYGHIVTWLQINDEEINSYYTSAYITQASYYRVFLADLLPDANTVLYIDADIIINASIKPLLTIDLKDIPLMAIKDAMPYKPERFGIVFPYDYFNAGVLLINLSEWRKHNYVAVLKENILANPENYPLHDQDLLNEFFHDKVKFLHPDWNHQTALYGQGKVYLESRYGMPVEELFHDPAIIHFTGWLKPWLYLNTHPLKPLFLKYLNQTPFNSFAEKGNPVLWLKRTGMRIRHKLKKILGS